MRTNIQFFHPHQNQSNTITNNEPYKPNRLTNKE